MLCGLGVYCCQFDEECVVSGGADASIRIWDTGSGEMKHVLTGHKAEIVRNQRFIFNNQL